MLHFGTHKSYDDDDEDDDIYGIDDWQETDNEKTNLQKQNMMYTPPPRQLVYNFAEQKE